jgi:hypothetical protein
VSFFVAGQKVMLLPISKDFAKIIKTTIQGCDIYRHEGVLSVSGEIVNFLTNRFSHILAFQGIPSLLSHS